MVLKQLEVGKTTQMVLERWLHVQCIPKIFNLFNVIPGFLVHIQFRPKKYIKIFNIVPNIEYFYIVLGLN